MATLPNATGGAGRLDSDQLERDVLTYWQEQAIFQRSLQARVDGPQFSFYDGPPYATGKPHYGHILQSSIKDSVLRYKTMQGYYVPRRVGWDCHGLPVEVLVEKELGLKTKQDIKKLGIAEFNAKCREVVFRYINEFTATLQRLGRWADYDHAYRTLDKEYMESEWWVFRQLWDQGLVYQAFRSTPYCIRCATPLSNFEVASSYQDKVDMAVYVKLKIVGAAADYLLVWTTTPWTLPANVGVAMNPELSYVSVQVDEEVFIVARDRVSALFGEDSKITREWTSDELLRITYEPLYSFLPAENAFRVVPSSHVTAVDGTGLVHMAPAYGEEDALVGKAEGLPTLKTVDANGNFIDVVTLWAGQNIFAANASIIADLQSRGALWREEQYTHSYPFCWRCDTPLIYNALDTWFIKISAIKDQLLVNNEQIKWIPEHVKRGRFGKGLESAPDWAVSRNRFWSVPVPIWECRQCQHRVCIGSLAQLTELSGQPPLDDIHRPMVDEVRWECSECSEGTMQRVEEVLDVWFDSGSMPYAQWHYPFENQEQVPANFPADFIVEAIEMTRTWFYVLHVLATALTHKDIGLGSNQPAFKQVIASGIIFAEDGRKLSKKLKNYPEIEPTLQKYGADVLRFYLLSSSTLGEPYRFSEKDLQQVQRTVYLTLWNVYTFFTRYAEVHKWQAVEDMPNSSHILDRWILARLLQLEQTVIGDMDNYRVDSATRAFVPFIDDLSNWYVRRSRARFQKPATAAAADEAFATLYTVLVRVSKLLAPAMPFVTEVMYRDLTQQDSVHLQDLPTLDKLKNESIDLGLVSAMEQTRKIVSVGLQLRAKAKIKVRQPLPELVVTAEKLPTELADLIKDEVNVKHIIFSPPARGGVPPARRGGGGSTDGYVHSEPDSLIKIALKITLTPDLAAEGIAREIIRHGQVLRRQAGYALDDRINLLVHTDSEAIQNALHYSQALIMQALQVETLVTDELTADAQATVKMAGVPVELGVQKVPH